MFIAVTMADAFTVNTLPITFLINKLLVTIIPNPELLSDNFQ